MSVTSSCNSTAYSHLAGCVAVSADLSSSSEISRASALSRTIDAGSMYADDQFLILCPDAISQKMWCMNPPSDGVCCG